MTGSAKMVLVIGQLFLPFPHIPMSLSSNSNLELKLELKFARHQHTPFVIFRIEDVPYSESNLYFSGI